MPDTPNPIPLRERMAVLLLEMQAIAERLGITHEIEHGDLVFEIQDSRIVLARFSLKFKPKPAA